jgi:hypothetical protein
MLYLADSSCRAALIRDSGFQAVSMGKYIRLLIHQMVNGIERCYMYVHR